MSERQQALKKWVSTELSNRYKQSIEVTKVTMIAGDASFRRYFRVDYNGTSYVIMDSPPEHEDCLPFVQIASKWIANGVRVPKILAQDLQQGFLMLEDFGDQLLRSRLTDESVDLLYTKALNELHRIQSLPTQDLPLYDPALLMREMSLFREWFLSSWLQLELSNEEDTCLKNVEALLIESAQRQPQVVVHRDYHSRNLMLIHNDEIGVIDFQDAVIGAVTYDLVSLLRDSYVYWPESEVKRWVKQFYSSSPWRDQLALHQFEQTFDWMGMQRQLKVCGIFVRLCQRDGKAGYLQDIPLTFRNLMQSSARYPELAEFTDWLQQRVLPALIKRPELNEMYTDLSLGFWDIA